MRSVNIHPSRRTGVRATVAATALATAGSLLSAGVAGGATGAAAPATADSQVAVLLKVADQPAQSVAAQSDVWPATMLSRYGVETDRNDKVRVLRDSDRVRGERRRLRHGDTVKVVRVDRDRTVRTVRVRPRTVTVATTSLKPGRRKVAFEGRPGVRRVKVLRTFHNHRVVERRVISRRLVKEPRARRVLVGRRPYSVPGADGLNWGALANCESGGNPRAVNPAGYYGLYQFNVATWRSVGGSGMPHHASAEQQTFRAKLLYKSRGRSPWPHCGRYL